MAEPIHLSPEIAANEAFEAGIRFVVERIETYSRGAGEELTQFGDYQMTMERRDRPLLPGSYAHQQRRVAAMLALAKREASSHG